MAILISALLGISVFFISYNFLYRTIEHITRKSETQIDDILVGILRKPISIILGICSFSYFLPEDKHIIYQIIKPFSEDIASFFEKNILKDINIILLIIVAWIVYKFIKEITNYYKKNFMRITESNLDDVMVPILQKIIPVIFITLFILIFIYIIFDFSGLTKFLTILGGISFILIYLFQEPLSNLFGGVSLLTDSPFKYGDLVILEDGKTYRVDDIGSRVTKLYNITEHTQSFVPNTSLSTQKLTNITKPNLELRVSLIVGVSYQTSTKTNIPEYIDMIKTQLLDIANKEPNILGSHDHKVKLLMDEKESCSNDLDKNIIDIEIERSKYENILRDKCELTSRNLYILYMHIKSLQFEGLTQEQRKLIVKTLKEFKEDLYETLTQHVANWLWYSIQCEAISIYVEYLPHKEKEKFIKVSKMLLEKKLKDIKEKKCLLGKKYNDKYFDKYIKAAPINGFKEYVKYLESGIENRQEIVELNFDKKNDILNNWIEIQTNNSMFKRQEQEFKEWDSRLLKLTSYIDNAIKKAENIGYDDFLIAHDIWDAWEWFNKNFKLKLEPQQYPRVNLKELGDYSIKIELQYYIDNISGENFERRDRVNSKINEEILKAFDNSNIEMPNPTFDVNLRS